MNARARAALLVLVAAAASAAGPARNASLPAASPDGTRIAYVSERDSTPELYLLELASGLSRRLTYSTESKSAPAWADSGRRIVYTTARGDSAALVSLDPETGRSHVRVTLRAKSIRLSSNGRRLAYTWGTWTRNRVVIANLDGSRANALTDSSAAWYNLAWSPDDSLIAATRQDSSGGFEIRLIRTNGRGHWPLVRVAPELGRPQWPAWSPDGRTLAFQLSPARREGPGSGDASVCTIDVKSGKITRLREHPAPILDETPCWLDDSTLVFQSTQTGAFELWKMRSSGYDAVRLTR